MNRVYGVGAAVLLVLGLGLGGGGLYLAFAEDAALSPSGETNGTVVESGVEPAPEADGYVPNVTYRYTVDGRTYTSDAVYPPTLGTQAGPRNWASGVAEEYEPGDTVTVTYDAEDPAEAYLRERRDPGPVISFGLGMVSLAFAFLLGVAAFQADRDVVQDEAGMVNQPMEDSGEE